MSSQFDRHVELFGEQGQNRLRKERVVVIGCGGTGSHIVQQLAFLGCEDFTLVDKDRVDPTSRNRLVGSRPEDVSDERFKVDVAADLVRSINPDAKIAL